MSSESRNCSRWLDGFSHDQSLIEFFQRNELLLSAGKMHLAVQLLFIVTGVLGKKLIL
jgi:hypothetical protein